MGTNECHLPTKCDASSKTNELKQIPDVRKKKTQQLTNKKKKTLSGQPMKISSIKYLGNAISYSELFLHACCTLIEHTQNLFPSNQQV